MPKAMPLPTEEVNIMDRRIFKYTLTYEAGGWCKPISVPRHAMFLDVQEQHDLFQVWCLIDTDQEEAEPWVFRIVPTGAPIKGLLGTYVKTIQCDRGLHVWHVFRVGSSEQFRHR